MEKQPIDTTFVSADDATEAGLLVNRDFALLTPVTEESVN